MSGHWPATKAAPSDTTYVSASTPQGGWNDSDVPAAAGYDGLVRAGTAALLAADDDWNPKGAANDLGYLRAVLQTLDSQG